MHNGRVVALLQCHHVQPFQVLALHLRNLGHSSFGEHVRPHRCQSGLEELQRQALRLGAIAWHRLLRFLPHELHDEALAKAAEDRADLLVVLVDVLNDLLLLLLEQVLAAGLASPVQCLAGSLGEPQGRCHGSSNHSTKGRWGACEPKWLRTYTSSVFCASARCTCTKMN
eukprot:3503809-Lingulodinium_polyedra.AAC.1